MEEIVEKLVRLLCERYGMFAEEAYSIIYSEWEYVESMIDMNPSRKRVCEKIANDLMKMYMVA